MASTINFDVTKEMALLKSQNTCKKCGKVYKDPVKIKVCGHLMCLICASSSCAVCGEGKGIQGPCNFTAKIVDWINEMERKYDYQNFCITDIPKLGAVVPAEKNSVQIIRSAMKRNSRGETGLHRACKMKKLESVQEFIKSGYDVNAVDWANWTPLHEAVQSNAYDCAKALLNAGALVNAPGENYITALHQAAEFNNDQMIKILLEFGANLKSTDYSGNKPSLLLQHEQKPTRERMFIDPIKEALILCINDHTKSILTKHEIVCTVKFNAKKTDVIVLGVDENVRKFSSLLAIQNGVPIVVENNIGTLFSGFPLNVKMPEELSEPLFASIMNKLHRKPKLFDGMKFHVVNNLKNVLRKDFLLTRMQVCVLIEAGGGKLLVRPPAERIVDLTEAQYPYHCKNTHKLKHCVNYIVYDSKTAPLLLYKMPELRHVSADWIVDCILSFKILDV